MNSLPMFDHEIPEVLVQNIHRETDCIVIDLMYYFHQQKLLFHLSHTVFLSSVETIGIEISHAVTFSLFSSDGDLLLLVTGASVQDACNKFERAFSNIANR